MVEPLLAYNLTPSAIQDLRGIARYTIEAWGQKQADKYSAKLAECFNSIAENQLVSRTLSKRLAKVRFVRCEHHYIFFIKNQHERPTIIAILYEKMDMLPQLSSRLAF